jgi:tetratricopeptide (TPR) repeat protein
VKAGSIFLLCLCLTLPVAAQQSDADEVLDDAQSYYDDGDYISAAGILETAILNGVDDDPALYTLLARSYWRMDYQYDEQIIAACDEALRLDDEAAACYALRAASNARLGNSATALEDLAALDALDSDDDVRLIRAAAYSALGDWTAGAELFMDWLDAQPEREANASNPLGLGENPTNLRVRSGEIWRVPLEGEAGQTIMINTYSMSIAVDTLLILLDPEGRPIAGDQMGDYYPGDAAIIDFALPASGTYTLLVTHGEIDTGGEVSLMARVMNADDYMQRGNRAFTQRNYPLAIRSYERAIDMGLNSADIYDSLGVAYYLTSDFESSVDAYNRAIEASPNYPYYYQSRGVNYAELGNYEQGLADLEYACQLNGGCDEGLLLARGIVYTLAARQAEAAGDTAQAAEFHAAAAQDYLDWINAFPVQQTALTEPLTPGEPIFLPIDQGWSYTIPLEGRAGDTYVITADAAVVDSWVDPLLVILDPQGTPIHGDDDGGGGGERRRNSRVVITLPEDGTYTILVGHAGDPSPGEIRVTLQIGQ